MFQQDYQAKGTTQKRKGVQEDTNDNLLLEEYKCYISL